MYTCQLEKTERIKVNNRNRKMKLKSCQQMAFYEKKQNKLFSIWGEKSNEKQRGTWAHKTKKRKEKRY